MSPSRRSSTLIGVGDVQAISTAPDSLFDGVSGALGDAAFVFGNSEWPYAEEPYDLHPVEAHAVEDFGMLDIADGDPANVAQFGRGGFNVMSVANNHSMHAGHRAFLHTMDLLRDVGIAPVGGGTNLEEALRPAIIERDGTRVGFVACTSQLLPGTHAGRKIPGVAPLRRHTYFQYPNWDQWGLEPSVGDLVNRHDLAALCESVRRAKEAADVVVVSCHWGVYEPRSAVADYQREAARALVDSGADLLLGHGPNLKGVEVYQGKAIFYSLGKFLLTLDGVDPSVFGTGLVTFVTIDDGAITRVAFTPNRMNAVGCPVLVGRNDEAFAAIVEDVRVLSAEAELRCEFSVEGDQVVVS
jgi:poly-gamma-glutamate capsule biosynthesis protein CapA/YwtB (metallophosphatase superfamily)